jgi:hypothetical protein
MAVRYCFQCIINMEDDLYDENVICNRCINIRNKPILTITELNGSMYEINNDYNMSNPYWTIHSIKTSIRSYYEDVYTDEYEGDEDGFDEYLDNKMDKYFGDHKINLIHNNKILTDDDIRNDALKDDPNITLVLST